jgi:nucleoside-diphosphate-sugar epimerase
MQKDFSFPVAMDLKGQRVLITGGAGYLATNLIGQLQDTECRITRLDRPGVKFMPFRGKSQVRDIVGDIRNRKVWEKVLVNVDIVFHLAAYEHSHSSEFNPILDFEVNALSVLHLLEVCRSRHLYPRVVFASSSNLIGLPSQLPVNETFPNNPLTIYAIHKSISEKYLQYYAREFGQRSIVLRLANVYGPVWNVQASVRVVLNRIICKAVKDRKISVYQNYACIRDYVWIGDVAAAFLAAAELGDEYATGQYYLIGSGQGHRILDVLGMIANRVEKRTGKRPVVEEDMNEKLETIEWRNFVADTTRFAQATGWKASVSLEEGIDRTIDYFLSEQGTL